MRGILFHYGIFHLPRLSPTMFDPDVNSVLLRAHLCTAVDSMRRKPWVRNCSRERKGLYNGNVQQNPLCAASCFTKDIPSLPGSRLRFFIAGQIQHRTMHRFLYTPAQVDATMYSSRLYAKNPVFEIVHEESVKVYHLHMYNGSIQQNSLCVESCVTEEFNILLGSRYICVCLLLLPSSPCFCRCL